MPDNLPVLKKVKETPDCYIAIYQEEASAGKKWGVGIASFFIPGLGQALFGFKMQKDLQSALEKAAKDNPKTMLLSHLSLAAGLIAGVWSIIDAVRSAGYKYDVTIPKENSIQNIISK